MQSRASHRDVATFLVLAFAISWLLWLPQLVTSIGLVQLPEAVGILGMVAPFGPFMSAFWLTSRRGGRVAVKGLWKRGWSLDWNKRWLLPTVLLMPGVSLVTVAVMALVGQPIQWEYGVPLGALGPTFVMIYLLNALPEEYGWRGYALGAMLSHRSALVASLILGAIWGLWHLPLHFIDGSVQLAISVYQFVLQQMVLAVFYSWLFNNTRGSVFVAILFHTIGNIMGAAVPHWTTDQGRWIGFGVLVVFAVVVVSIWGPQHLNRSLADRYSPDESDSLKGPSSVFLASSSSQLP